MATETSGNSNGFLYFIVGVLLVGVVVLGFMFYNNGGVQSPTESAVERTADAVGDAADDVGDAARKANPDG
jgi:hypothetical protein